MVNQFLMSDFYESSFDNKVRQIEYELTSAISLFVENQMNGLYMEAKGDSLWDSIKKFFAKMMETMNTYARDLQARIEDAVRTKEIHRKLKQLQMDLTDKSKKGATTVRVMDVWKYRDTYLRMNADLWRRAKKFAKTKYSKTYEIEDDLKEFDQIVDEYVKEIEKIQETRIEVPIQKMIAFVEDELRGKSDVIASLNSAMTKYREMERDALNLKNRYRILGSDVLPKHVGLIKRVTRTITDFIHKFVVKFVTTVVFVFA